MAANMGLKEIGKLRGRVASMQKRTQKLRAEATVVVGRVLRTAEVGGVAFGFGVLQGKQGEIPTIMGVPADLLAGLGLHAIAFLGVAEDMTPHMVGLADGALASYLHTTGVSIGAGMGTPRTSGMLEQEEGDLAGLDLTDDEYAALAAY